MMRFKLDFLENIFWEIITLNILIVGNGFDLAHGLQTTYIDFLEFAKTFKNYAETNLDRHMTKSELNTEFNVVHFVLSSCGKKEKIFNELKETLIDNIWIEYFECIYQRRKDKGKNGWIDFENEISQVIQTIDKIRCELQKNKLNEDIKNNLLISDKQIISYLGFEIDNSFIENMETRKRNLLKDLNRLRRGLEIYLSYYIERVNPETRLFEIESLDIQKVLSFNYTDTYQRLYEREKTVEYDYIHGKVNLDSNVDNCNLILGIDEYLKKDDRGVDNEFIEFKKFYQRIYKKTGCKYVDWVKEIERQKKIYTGSNAIKNNVYIIGHSLDVTDGDVLTALINMSNTSTTIFYHNHEAMGKQICNLVKILGEEELIARVHGSDATIVFKEQKITRVTRRLPLSTKLG